MRWFPLQYTTQSWGWSVRHWTRKQLVCAFLLLFLACFSLSLLHHVDALKSNTGIQVGNTLPAARLRRSDGGWKETADWLGRPLVLILFKAACGACQQHIRQLAKLYRRSPSLRGIQFALVSVDPSLTSFSLEDHLSQLEGLPRFPVYVDPTGRYVESAQRMRVPTTYLIDKRGSVRYVRSGVMNSETAEAMLRSLLACEGEIWRKY